MIAALHQSRFTEGWDQAAVASLLALPTTHGRALEQSGTIVGVVLAQCAAGEAEILTIAVAAAHGGQGFGDGLMSAIERDLTTAGARRLTLEVAADNAPALALYRRRGLAPVANRRGYYQRAGAAAVDAIVMARLLG
jgi:[ribosomal protein S18]-alanine N-acetyltransferase